MATATGLRRFLSRHCQLSDSLHAAIKASSCALLSDGTVAAGVQGENQFMDMARAASTVLRSVPNVSNYRSRKARHSHIRRRPNMIERHPLSVAKG